MVGRALLSAVLPVVLDGDQPGLHRGEHRAEFRDLGEEVRLAVTVAHGVGNRSSHPVTCPGLALRSSATTHILAKRPSTGLVTGPALST